MTSDAVNSLPRKKRSVLRWIAALFLSLLLLFLFQLLGPDPRIVISRPTTFITEPLRPNGLPDYERYVLELNRNCVTPQENAAAILCLVLQERHAAYAAEIQAVRTELGVVAGAAAYPALESAYDNKIEKVIFEWIREQNAEFYKTRDRDFTVWNAVEKLIDHCMSRPWTARDCPVLADFLRTNEPQLDLIVAASTRPRCYWPTPSLLNNTNEALVCDNPCSVWRIRNVTNLALRAMLRAGEGGSGEAWDDLLALYRLARLCGQGNSVQEQWMAFYIEGAAHTATIALVHHGELTIEQLRKVLHDLESLPPYSGLVRCVDTFERLQTLDFILHLADGDMDQLRDVLELPQGFTYADFVYVDWNSVLAKTNAWYDRLAAALEISDFAARTQAVDAVYAGRRHTSDYDGLRSLAGVILSRRYRADLAMTLAWDTFAVEVEMAVWREALENTHLELARLSAALAVFRATHQHYPDNLEEISPGILKELPIDLYGANRFVYRRDGDGFLLYSKGLNGVDDGGSDERRSILEGRPYDDADIDERMPPDADDVAVCVPYSAFEVPRPTF